MDGLQWKTLLKWMIWGYPYFRKHPNGGFCIQVVGIYCAAKDKASWRGKDPKGDRVFFGNKGSLSHDRSFEN